MSHSILLYNTSYDDVFFITRVLHGLKEEISAPIALHCPPNVDTASALALLQKKSWTKLDRSVPIAMTPKRYRRLVVGFSLPMTSLNPIFRRMM